MNDNVIESEREIRRAIRRMGYDIEHLSVDRNYDDEWVLELAVNVHPNENRVDKPLE